MTQPHETSRNLDRRSFLAGAAVAAAIPAPFGVPSSRRRPPVHPRHGQGTKRQ